MADARTELIDALAAHIDTPTLSPAESESVLALAAVAAHGTGDRTAAPLASYLAGLAAAKSANRIDALDDVRRRAAEIAPATQTG